MVLPHPAKDKTGYIDVWLKDRSGLNRTMPFPANKELIFEARFNLGSKYKIRWEFGDGSGWEYGQSFPYSYKESGNYHVKCTISDSVGYKVTCLSKTVVIS